MLFFLGGTFFLRYAVDSKGPEPGPGPRPGPGRGSGPGSGPGHGPRPVAQHGHLWRRSFTAIQTPNYYTFT